MPECAECGFAFSTVQDDFLCGPCRQEIECTCTQEFRSSHKCVVHQPITFIITGESILDRELVWGDKKSGPAAPTVDDVVALLKEYSTMDQWMKEWSMGDGMEVVIEKGGEQRRLNGYDWRK